MSDEQKQSIPHFFGWPFSGIEYGVAQLGAVQIWCNALDDQAEAVTRYRKALFREQRP